MKTDEYGVQYSDDGKELLFIPSKLSGEYIVPDCVEEIREDAFLWDKYHHPKLKGLRIGKSVKKIHFNHGFMQLDSLTVDEENPYFDSRENCNCIIDTAKDKIEYAGLNSFIPNGIKMIGPWAFNFPWPVHMNEIYIPSSVEEIWGNAFDFCEADKIVVDKKNKFFDSREDCNAIIDSRTNSLKFGCKNTVIPYGVEIIDSHAFFSINGKVKQLVLPDSLTTIYPFALYFASIGEMTIPKSVIHIKSYAIWASAIRHLRVHRDNPVYDSREDSNCIIETRTNKLIAIGSGKHITIPNSVKILGNGSICSHAVSELIIPEGVEYIERYVFELGPRKFTITFPNSIKDIAEQFWVKRFIKKFYVPKGQRERFAAMEGMKGVKSKIFELKD